MPISKIPAIVCGERSTALKSILESSQVIEVVPPELVVGHRLLASSFVVASEPKIEVAGPGPWIIVAVMSVESLLVRLTIVV